MFKGMSMMVAVLIGYGSASAQSPCQRQENEQFGFWAGEWSLTWQDQHGKTQTGTNRIEWILGGCVLQESFEDPTGGLIGRSWSVYDPASGKWKQTWVDNQGSYLDFVGERRDGRMSLEREAMVEGKSRRQRMTFYNITPDSLDWDWEGSGDGGATWKLAWRIHYVRKKP